MQTEDLIFKTTSSLRTIFLILLYLTIVLLFLIAVLTDA